MKEEIFDEYLKRVEDCINFNSNKVALSLDEQLQLLSDCKVIIKEYKKVNELMKYYRSEHVNVAIYWKNEIESHRKTKNELRNTKLKFKDLQQKYYSLVENKGCDSNVCI